VGKTWHIDEFPLFPVTPLETFDKWVIDFVGPINLPTCHTGERYIINATKYLTRWAEATPIKDCIVETAVHFNFDNIITKFICQRVLMSDQGSQFLNETIQKLTQEFTIHRQKSTPYHPQDNGTVEAFNKILEHALTKVFNVQHDDWDQCILTVLWAYQTMCKRMTKNTLFRLVYGKEAIMPLEFVVPSLRVSLTT
jgi:transposase InsO family protein